jgi:hypothetical protein
MPQLTPCSYVAVLCGKGAEDNQIEGSSCNLKLGSRIVLNLIGPPKAFKYSKCLGTLNCISSLQVLVIL